VKLITALVKPERVDAVKEALRGVGVRGLTISDARGFGQQGGRVEMYRGSEALIDEIPKARIELVVQPPEVQDTVRRIVGAARTGSIGDGKIWVTDVEHVVRIRTGELDAEAL
jgi:nitrogen regulatory protein P-II 1